MGDKSSCIDKSVSRIEHRNSGDRCRQEHERARHFRPRTSRLTPESRDAWCVQQQNFLFRFPTERALLTLCYVNFNIRFLATVCPSYVALSLLQSHISCFRGGVRLCKAAFAGMLLSRASPSLSGAANRNSHVPRFLFVFPTRF